MPQPRLPLYKRKGNFNLKKVSTETRHHQSEHLDDMSSLEILQLMNTEDQTLPALIASQLASLEKVIGLTTHAYRHGAKVIYIGAGTSGRLGILDAAELVPTFNADPKRYFGLIAGGSKAMTQAIEGAEDNTEQGKLDLQQVQLTSNDVVIGIAASGRTPYVIGALSYAQNIGCQTVAISCNTHSKISAHADIPIEIPVGPEILTGSTRLKAGTAQKMVLNMISTVTMIRVGKVYDNLMIDVQATNEKLIQRAIGIIQTITQLDVHESLKLYEAAQRQIKPAIVMHFKALPYREAQQLLQRHHGNVKDILKKNN